LKNIVASLLEEARLSQHSESSRILAKNEDIRIVAVARMSKEETPALLLEVAVILNPSETVDLDKLNRKMTLLKELESRGHVLSCQDESIIFCDIPTSEDSVLVDLKTIKQIINIHNLT